MCTDPEVIEQILKSDEFGVHDFKVDQLAKRLSLDLGAIQKLTAYFPLAREGEEHKILRKRFIDEIARNYKTAIIAFEKCLGERCKLLEQHQGEIDLVPALLTPSLALPICLLAGIRLGEDFDFWSISQILDETISIRQRIKINQTISIIMESLPPEMDEGERLFRTALVTLGSNALYGSIAESFVIMLKKHKPNSFSSIAWDEELPATGIPVIEKKAMADVIIEGHAFCKGERVRLYLEATGYQGSVFPSYTKQYFAPSRHLCPGMSFSRDVWKLFRHELGIVRKRFSIMSISYRENDNVFNFPNSIILNLYD